MPRPLTPDQQRALLAEVRHIYAELAERPMDRQCISRSACCRFRLTGRTPFLTRGEAMVAAAALRASGRRQLPASSDGSCPLLRDGQCSIYDSRPFGCRTHFCQEAGGPAPRALVRDLIQRLEDIDHALGGSGGVNLPTAIAAALNDRR
ncbi:MAG: hypothetical protein RLZZ179_758 [Verrucomicrobiota bacterium]|jgi:hypothetical protein